MNESESKQQPKPISQNAMTEKKALRKQEWVCEGCGLSGAVTYADPAGDVFAVFRLVRDHHESLASKYAPLCHFDVDQVRVRNNAVMDVYAWNRLVAKIEKDCGRSGRLA
jgi:hypothetical protein